MTAATHDLFDYAGADEWTPKRGRWGGGRGRGGRSSWQSAAHAENEHRDRCALAFGSF